MSIKQIVCQAGRTCRLDLLHFQSDCVTSLCSIGRVGETCASRNLWAVKLYSIRISSHAGAHAISVAT